MTSYWNDFPPIPEALQEVSGIIRESTSSTNPVISRGINELLDGEGKMLRPGLLLLSARFGKLEKKHYKLAAALEILHMATLVHDDVIDDSPLRRGLPTVQSRYGKRDAVLIGDFMLSRCFMLGSEFTSPKNAAGLARLISAMCMMEITQNNDRFKADISLRAYLRKIAGKSALLFSLACFSGAFEAGLSPALCETLRRAGYNIGMAFQIKDDCLDYSGDEGVVRKPLGSDIAEGLITLPAICAASRDKALGEVFKRGRFTPEEAPRILDMVRKAEGPAAAAAYAGRYTERALAEIRKLPACKTRDMLDELTRRLLVRER